MLQGTLDLIVLRTLLAAPAHGHTIAKVIARRSDDFLQVEEGSLYPALQRMLVKGWIVGDWSRTPENRRARYYRLTAAGKRQLEREIASYQRAATAIALILQPA